MLRRPRNVVVEADPPNRGRSSNSEWRKITLKYRVLGYQSRPETLDHRIVGPRARGNSLQAGVGLKVNTGGVVDYFVNYDLYVTNHYRSLNASLGLGFVFYCPRNNGLIG
jgi:hypothetical protein